jgi:2Fe-2S ferredoxin
MAKYRVRFLPMDKVVEVDTAAPAPGHNGEPGSLLRIALANGIEVDHACGGVCACSTCHVIVREGGESIPAAADDEEDQLDNARGLTVQSRLACQAVPCGDRNLVVEIPQWNRNLAQEGPR